MLKLGGKGSAGKTAGAELGGKRESGGGGWNPNILGGEAEPSFQDQVRKTPIFGYGSIIMAIPGEGAS